MLDSDIYVLLDICVIVDELYWVGVIDELLMLEFMIKEDYKVGKCSNEFYELFFKIL